jgi:formamidopyrimidine-DNA glycosylase
VPELPEVETMRRMVERELVGLTLDAIDLRLSKLTRDSPLPDLGLLVGRSILAARRRAKVLVIDWSDGLSTMTHFKLSGQLAILRRSGGLIIAGHPVPSPTVAFPHKSTHLILRFTDGTIAYYSDLRQFGWWRLLPTDAVEDALAVFAFGPEGVGVETMTVTELGERLASRRIALKLALLDQKVVAGLGNIYVDEALHRAKLHPMRPANSLSDAELARLHEAVPWSLERGLEQGGAKIIRGRAHPIGGFPQVHGREGEACDTCGGPIVKIRVGSRGTYLCPVCQPAPAS